MRHRPVGRRGVLLEPEALEPGVAVPATIAAAVRQLAEQLGTALEDVVPGAGTVLVLARDQAGMARLLAALPDLADVKETLKQDGPTVELPVRYDGPDLAAVADATGFSVEEIVRRHSSATYEAAFTGFAPGFAYLTGIDPALQLPRRDTPRPAVPAGSLAIADTWTAVYPRSSPGGWHLLGTVDVMMFDLHREPAALVSPGQSVRFIKVRQ